MLDIKVGDGMTVCGYTDRQSYTVIKMTRCSLTLQRDQATLLDKPIFVPGGFCAHCVNQYELRYKIEPDPSGWVIKARWSPKKNRYFNQGCKPVLSGRSEFYDYNF